MLFEIEVADMRSIIYGILLVALLVGRAFAVAEHAPAGAKSEGTAGARVEGSAAHSGEEEGSLLPDFQKRETWMSALWVVIIFLVLLAVLYPTAWKNVLAGLKAREDRIRKDIAEAEATR